MRGFDLRSFSRDKWRIRRWSKNLNSNIRWWIPIQLLWSAHRHSSRYVTMRNPRIDPRCSSMDRPVIPHRVEEPVVSLEHRYDSWVYSTISVRVFSPFVSLYQQQMVLYSSLDEAMGKTDRDPSMERIEHTVVTGVWRIRCEGVRAGVVIGLIVKCAWSNNCRMGILSMRNFGSFCSDKIFKNSSSIIGNSRWNFFRFFASISAL